MKSLFLTIITLLVAFVGTVKSQDCTFISIVMDESGSMGGEQEFLRNEAMPEVIQDLNIRLKRQVFVCSYGFPGSGASPARVIGCSDGYDVDDYSFVTSASGGREDGWAAIKFADEHSKSLTDIDGKNPNSCGTIAFFMILVTDEDRDNTEPISSAETQAILEDGRWSLHAILNQQLIPEESVGAVQIDSSLWTVYVPDEDNVAYRYAESPTNTFPIGEGCCVNEYDPIPGGVLDYYPLAFATDGAVWNINKLRAGGFATEAFTNAFIGVTTEAFDPDPECPFSGIFILDFILCLLWNVWKSFSGLFPNCGGWFGPDCPKVEHPWLTAIRDCSEDKDGVCAQGRKTNGIFSKSYSHTEAQLCKTRLASKLDLKERFDQAASGKEIPVEILLSLACRESRMGYWIDPENAATCTEDTGEHGFGWGDWDMREGETYFQCHGFGVMQIDKGSFMTSIRDMINTPAPEGGPYGLKNILFGAQRILECHAEVEEKIEKTKVDGQGTVGTPVYVKNPYAWTPAYVVKGAAVCYNGGVGNVRTMEGLDVGTTGDDYGSDIMTMAMWFLENLGE